MTNEQLRKECKMLKALQGISYTELAEYLEIKQQSMYNFLKGEYDLSIEKQQKLFDIITNLKEV